MLKMEEIKRLIKSTKEFHRFALPNERQTRRAISNLVLEGYIYAPLKKNIYCRVDRLEDLSEQELIKFNTYMNAEIQSAIKLFRRMKKLEKFMSNEQKKILYGELV